MTISNLMSSVDRREQLLDLRRRCRARVSPGFRRAAAASAATAGGRLSARRSRAAARIRRAARALDSRSTGVARRSPPRTGRPLRGHERAVEAQRRRQAERVHRAVREAVARRRAPAPSRARARARRARAPDPRAAAPRSSSSRASRSCGDSTTRGSARGDQRGARERLLVACVAAAPHVERLGAVSERVQRGPDRLGARQPERQVDVVDDRDRVRVRRRRPACGGRASGRRRTSSTRRPSRSSAPRRAEAPSPPRRLAGVDRRAAADREDAVGAARQRDARARHLRPSAGTQRQLEAAQRGARDRNGWAIPDSASTSGSSPSAQRTITGGGARELDELACGARLRAAARATRKISRSSSRPATRASASVPAARSASIEVREMNVTP